ncbi:MAG: Excinuclease ABC subunit C [Candidatus Giovannonibacteria bacterium GW2011_GWC2_44_9]|uniref:Excinuclease ABC subunit C n=2 Tax=Candidatus Giovannoniibacteriota TaxID=1752738 RepID=A0A0G1L8K1_9BACT|nr:MAG: Excinuclease ABC subunit C [Candidatus Giovannonibacteria bacterium GW2011_GWB1_44_23]KKT82681.1 MAG: Excinuclease ABC subunit C [Candidatus Giovannonibacteria bacterium GW2011_GWC2_44_9]
MEYALALGASAERLEGSNPSLPNAKINNYPRPWFSGRSAPMAIGETRAQYMNFVYILQSEKNGRYYIGSTNDLELRLLEHNAGKTKSLRHLKPLKLVFKKEVDSLNDARKIEKKLKKLKNGNIIDKIVADGDITGFAAMV